MKRSILIFLLVGALPAVAGWAVAFLGARHRAHKAMERARLAETAELKRPAQYLGRLVVEADEIVISYSSVHEERRGRLKDPAWLARLSRIVGAASYARTPHGFWLSFPEIRLFRKHTQIFELTMLGKVLRVYSEKVNGDFIVGATATEAILALAHAPEVMSVLHSEKPRTSVTGSDDRDNQDQP